MSTPSVYKEWVGRISEKFMDRHPESARSHEKAQKYLPGGIKTEMLEKIDKLAEELS